MTAEIRMRVPREADVLALAANLRQSDRDELAAVCDLPVLQAVRLSVAMSDPAFLWAVFADRQLLCLAGLTPAADGRSAAPWLLATPSLAHYPGCLTKTARLLLPAMLARYALLSNLIDARQTASIRWLQALGFSLTPAQPVKAGFPLYRFQRALNPASSCSEQPTAVPHV